MSMKYLAAYALASLQNPTPSAADVETICKACGIQVESDTLSLVMELIANRSVATLVAEGAAKMSAATVSTVAVGGGAAVAGGGAPAAAAAAPAAAAKEEEEEDDDMGFGLFD